MKILYVNYTDALGARFNGGALVPWLRENGHQAVQAVNVKQLDDNSSVLLPGADGRLGKAFSRLAKRVEEATSLQSVFHLQSLLLPFSEEFMSADIVHYHIIHNQYFSYMALPWLTRLKPTVWSLHDPWALTGHCVHPFDCDGWKSTGCSPCPHLDYPFAIQKDRAWLNYRLKSWVYRHSNLNLVVASKWMKDLVQQSPILGGFPTSQITFGLDLDVFSPGDKVAAKAVYGIGADKIVVGLRALQGPYKGYEYALAALKAMPSSLPLHILTCQSSGLYQSISGKFPVTDLGEIHGDTEMANFFRASDVHLMPSMAESFGMMAMEAAASGVPSVVFSDTPLSEVCFAPEGGISVPKGDVAGLSRALERLVTDSGLRCAMGQRARDLAVCHYGFEAHATQMLALYEALLLRPIGK